MNRREALKAVAAALPIGCAGSELAIGAGDELIAFKVTANCALSCHARESLNHAVREIFTGTKFADVPVFVCERDVDVQVIKRSDISRPITGCEPAYSWQPVEMKLKPITLPEHFA